MPADDDLDVFFPGAGAEHDRLFDGLEGSDDTETVNDRAIKSGSGSSIVAVIAAVAVLGWLALSAPADGDHPVSQAPAPDREAAPVADTGEDRSVDTQVATEASRPSRSMTGTKAFKLSVRDGLLMDCDRHLAPEEPYFESWPEYERCINLIMTDLEEICLRSATAQFYYPDIEAIDLACRSNEVG